MIDVDALVWRLRALGAPKASWFEFVISSWFTIIVCLFWGVAECWLLLSACQGICALHTSPNLDPRHFRGFGVSCLGNSPTVLLNTIISGMNINCWWRIDGTNHSIWGYLSWSCAALFGRSISMNGWNSSLGRAILLRQWPVLSTFAGVSICCTTNNHRIGRAISWT